MELLLTPLEVSVQTDIKLMSEPPRADILLLRRTGPDWTAGQKALLPDGIRETQAGHILVEFKYTESLNQQVLAKTQGYDVFYRLSQRLSREAVQTVIVSAKTPRREFLERFEYEPSGLVGVYQSRNVMLAPIGLVVLNQLRDEPHNAFMKCFASRRVSREQAFEVLLGLEEGMLGEKVWQYLSGLQQLLQMKGVGEAMAIEVTAEDVMNLGEELRAKLLATIPLEDRLAGLEPEEVLSRYAPEEVLSRYEPEEVLSRYAPEERLKGLEAYLEEHNRQLALRGLQRQVQIRFNLSEADLQAVQERLAPLGLPLLEKLGELVVSVEKWAEFEQALIDLSPGE